MWLFGNTLITFQSRLFGRLNDPQGDRMKTAEARPVRVADKEAANSNRKSTKNHGNIK
jgi:hypothetical protein